jgi:hypothetical protein
MKRGRESRSLVRDGTAKALRPRAHKTTIPPLPAVGNALSSEKRSLTSLAPDIIEAILRGDEPDGLSLEKLRKNLPAR